MYITDDAGRLAGIASLHDLVISPADRTVAEMMRLEVTRVSASDDQETAARLLRQTGYLAAPVVDDERRLLGIITADDVAEVLEREATEDIERLGGSQPLDEPYLGASVFRLFRKRMGGSWCCTSPRPTPERCCASSRRSHQSRRARVLHPTAHRHGREHRLADGDHARACPARSGCLTSSPP